MARETPFYPIDPYDALLLQQSQMLLDRHHLRSALARLEQDARLLVINGPAFSGKSHSMHFISYIWFRKKTFSPAFIDLKNAPANDLSPDIIVEKIALQISADIPIDKIPKQTSTSVVWARDLAGWLLRHAEKSPDPWWLVFDGADHPSLPVEVQYFIQELMQQTWLRDRNVRIVLLGCLEELLPLNLLPDILRVELNDPITADDVRNYLHDMFCQKNLSSTRPHFVSYNSGEVQVSPAHDSDAQIRQAVDEVMRFVLESMHKAFPDWEKNPTYQSHPSLMALLRQITENFFLDRTPA